MPGISAIVNKLDSGSIADDFCAKIRKEMLHFQFYLSKKIIVEDSINIGFTGYEEYPLTIIDDNEFNLVLEGRIYNLEKDILETTLRQLAEAQIRSDNTFDNELKAFLIAAEGEFIITIYDKIRKQLILANDIMGRIPLYYFQNSESLIFSRELKFILPFLPEVKFNEHGILEYLLYGFPFGENTLVEKVGFFPSATLINFNMISGKSSKQAYHTMNMDACTCSVSRKKTVTDMSRIFMEALSDRVGWVDNNKTIVSLSGGLDSRGTLAGLKKLGLSPPAVTAQSEEEDSARAVAGYLNAEVYAIPQGHVKERPFADIVFLKDGLDCHPDLEQLYQNLQYLRDHFGGDIVYFTGIYGGEITRQSHPTTGLSSINSLVHYLMNADDSYKYSTEKVAAILQTPKIEINKHLQMHLDSFPEKNFRRKYLRFRHEFDIRFAGEAEDRNRFYFWTISPFFAFPFFKYVMNIDENKKTSRLFRDFLFLIDPNTCKSKYFNYGLPLDNTVILYILSFAEKLSRHVIIKNNIRKIIRLLKLIKKLIRFPNSEEQKAIRDIRVELLDLLGNSKPIRDFFNYPGLPALILMENDMTGLERLRITFAYLDRATRWHALLCKKQ